MISFNYNRGNKFPDKEHFLANFHPIRKYREVLILSLKDEIRLWVYNPLKTKKKII